MTLVSSISLATAVLIQNSLCSALDTDDLGSDRDLVQIWKPDRSDGTVLFSNSKNFAEGQSGCSIWNLAKVNIKNIVLAPFPCAKSGGAAQQGLKPLPIVAPSRRDGEYRRPPTGVDFVP